MKRLTLLISLLFALSLGSAVFAQEDDDIIEGDEVVTDRHIGALPRF